MRDVFEEGWQGCKSGLQVSTTGGPFFDENPRQGGCIYNFQFQYPRCGAVCPAMFLPVLMIGGKCLCFRAKAAHISGHLPIVIQLFTDAADFFAVRQNMLGIKARAEGVAPISQAILNTEAALMVVMFLGFLIAEIGLVVRRDWLRPLLAVSATGLLLVGLVLIRPPVWVDGLVTLGICVGLWWIYRPAVRRASVRERVPQPSPMA